MSKESASTTPRKIPPWGPRPKKLTPAEGETLARDIIAWRTQGFPDPEQFEGWSDADRLGHAISPPAPGTLRLGGLKLAALPASLAESEGVEALFLDGNKLARLDAAVLGRLPLQTLSVSSNPLTALPPDILAIETLTDLYLADTRLKTLPIPAAPNPTLRVLGLDRIAGLSVPDGLLAKLPDLRTLLLGGSGLTALPDDLFSLSRLQQLDLQASPLEALPDAIGRLRELLVLNLGDCRLTTLPKALGTLDSLRDGAAKTNFFGLVLAGNPFTDAELRRIADLRNPERTSLALDWCKSNGTGRSA